MKLFCLYGVLASLILLEGGGWGPWSASGSLQEDFTAAALCPDPQDIFPCVCTNYSLSNMQMDCSGVVDEAQLAAAFTAYFPVTNFKDFIIRNNPWLRELRDGALGNITFQKFFVMYAALQTVEDNALAASYSTAISLQFLHNNISTFPFQALPMFTQVTLLDLSYNRVDQFPVLNSSTLETIHLNNNPLNVLPVTAFVDTPALSIIYLEEIGLQDIASGTFTGLEYLWQVYLFRNQLTQIPMAAVEFNLSKNALLFLSLNNISSVAVDAFTGILGGTIEIQGNALRELEEQVWRPLLEEGVMLKPYNNPLTCGCDIAWLVMNRTFIGQIEPMFTRCADGRLVSSLDPADYVSC